MNKVHFSSRSHDWETPQAFFDAIDAEFGFTLDAAALAHNAKCADFYTPELDAMARPWPGVVWLNPPYGRGIGRWIQKAWEESQRGGTVVVLMPVRSDTPYWHDFVMRASEVRLVRGRLAFTGGVQENVGSHNAPFPCCVVVFRPYCQGPPAFSSISRGGSASTEQPR